MKTFLAYWKRTQILRALSLRTLPHAASNQFSRVKRGDRVWICGLHSEAAELFAIGYIDVGHIFGEERASTEMSRRFKGYRVWPAKTHVLAKQGNECRTKLVSLLPIYSSIEFSSGSSPRLVLTQGHPNTQQLQTMRQLTPATAKLLEARWQAQEFDPESEAIHARETFDFDQLDSVRMALARMEQQAARTLLLAGKPTGQCCFCGRWLPASLLVAAHIKPRSACSIEEKRLIEVNIIALCKLGCDDLFERGYVEVRDGVIVAGDAKPLTNDVSTCVSAIVRRSVAGWTPHKETFFCWRRDNRAAADDTTK